MFWDTALNRADDAILKTMTDAQTHHEHAETPGKIFLLRHGQTDWNINHRFQGRTDIPLNDTGREQIRGAVPQLREMAQRGVQIDGVVSSRLRRVGGERANCCPGTWGAVSGRIRGARRTLIR